MTAGDEAAQFGVTGLGIGSHGLAMVGDEPTVGDGSSQRAVIAGFQNHCIAGGVSAIAAVAEVSLLARGTEGAAGDGDIALLGIDCGGTGDGGVHDSQVAAAGPVDRNVICGGNSTTPDGHIAATGAIALDGGIVTGGIHGRAAHIDLTAADEQCAVASVDRHASEGQNTVFHPDGILLGSQVSAEQFNGTAVHADQIAVLGDQIGARIHHRLGCALVNGDGVAGGVAAVVVDLVSDLCTGALDGAAV